MHIFFDSQFQYTSNIINLIQALPYVLILIDLDTDINFDFDFFSLAFRSSQIVGAQTNQIRHDY